MYRISDYHYEGMSIYLCFNRHMMENHSCVSGLNRFYSKTNFYGNASPLPYSTFINFNPSRERSLSNEYVPEIPLAVEYARIHASTMSIFSCLVILRHSPAICFSGREIPLNRTICSNFSAASGAGTS